MAVDKGDRQDDFEEVGPDVIETPPDDEEIVVHVPAKTARTAEIVGLSVMAGIMLIALVISIYCFINSRRRQQSLEKIAESLNEDEREDTTANNSNNSGRPSLQLRGRGCCSCCRPDYIIEEILLNHQAKKNARKRSIEEGLSLLEEGVRHQESFERFLKKPRTSTTNHNTGHDNNNRRRHRHSKHKHHPQLSPIEDRSTAESTPRFPDFNASRNPDWGYYESGWQGGQRYDRQVPAHRPPDSNQSARYVSVNSRNRPFYSDDRRLAQYQQTDSCPSFPPSFRPQYERSSQRPSIDSCRPEQHQRNNNHPDKRNQQSRNYRSSHTNFARPQYQRSSSSQPSHSHRLPQHQQNSNYPPHSGPQHQQNSNYPPHSPPQYQQSAYVDNVEQPQYRQSSRHPSPCEVRPQQCSREHRPCYYTQSPHRQYNATEAQSGYGFSQSYVPSQNQPESCPDQRCLQTPPNQSSYRHSNPYYAEANNDPATVDSYCRLNVSQNYNCEDSGVSSYPSNTNPPPDQTPSPQEVAEGPNPAEACAKSVASSAAPVKQRTLPRVAENIASACQAIASSLSRKQSSQYKIVPNTSPEAETDESGSLADDHSSGGVSSESDISVGKRRQGFASRIPWLRMFAKKSSQARKTKDQQERPTRGQGVFETNPLLGAGTSESEDTHHSGRDVSPIESKQVNDSQRPSSVDSDRRHDAVQNYTLPTPQDEHPLPSDPGHCARENPEDRNQHRVYRRVRRLRKKGVGYEAMPTDRWCQEENSPTPRCQGTMQFSPDTAASVHSLGSPLSASTPATRKTPGSRSKAEGWKSKTGEGSLKVTVASIGPSSSDDHSQLEGSLVHAFDMKCSTNDLSFEKLRDGHTGALFDKCSDDADENLIHFDETGSEEEDISFGPFLSGSPAAPRTKSPGKSSYFFQKRSSNSLPTPKALSSCTATEVTSRNSDAFSQTTCKSENTIQISGAPRNFTQTTGESNKSSQGASLYTMFTTMRDKSGYLPFTTEMPSKDMQLSEETDCHGAYVGSDDKSNTTGRFLTRSFRSKHTQKNFLPNLGRKTETEKASKSKTSIPDTCVDSRYTRLQICEPKIYPEQPEAIASTGETTAQDSGKKGRKPTRRALFGRDDAYLSLDENGSNNVFRVTSGRDQTVGLRRNVKTSDLSSSII